MQRQMLMLQAQNAQLSFDNAQMKLARMDEEDKAAPVEDAKQVDAEIVDSKAA